MSQSLEAPESETTKTSRTVASGKRASDERGAVSGAGDRGPATDPNSVRAGHGNGHAAAQHLSASSDAIATGSSEQVFFREGELGAYTGGPLEFHDVEGLGPESRPSRILYVHTHRRRQAGVGVLAILGTAAVFFVGSLLVTRVIDLTRGPHIEVKRAGGQGKPQPASDDPSAEGTQAALAARGPNLGGAGVQAGASPGAAAPSLPDAPPAAEPRAPAVPAPSAQPAPQPGGAQQLVQGQPEAAGAQNPLPVAEPLLPAAPTQSAKGSAEPAAVEAQNAVGNKASARSNPGAKPKAQVSPKPQPTARASKAPVAAAPVTPPARPLPAAGLGGSSSTAAKKPPTASF